MIPKIIWQTHEWEYDQLPPNFKRASYTWRNLNPGWDYRYYSSIDRALSVREFDKDFYKYYALADRITQSDIWRYIMIYQHGGLYTDMDSFCSTPIDYCLEKYDTSKEMYCNPLHEVVEKDKTIEWLNNDIFAAKKQSNIIKELLDYVYQKYRSMDILDIYNSGDYPNVNKLSSPQKSILWLGSETFRHVIYKNKDRIYFSYGASTHSSDIKNDFRSDFEVDYYGNKRNYSDLCIEFNLEDPKY